MNFTHTGKERPVVFAQFGEHIERIDIFSIVVAEALQARNVSNRSDGDAADLAHTLGDVVGHRKDLAGLIVEQEVVVAKVRPAHMPMKVLGLDIKSKSVGEQRIEGAASVFDGFGTELAGSRQCGPATGFQSVLSSRHVSISF